MTRTIAIAALLAGMMSSAGCCLDCLHSPGDRPLTRAMAGGPCAICGGGCGAKCRKVHGGDCGDSCGHHGVRQGPIDDCHDGAACGSGCGEVYWDEWVSDPPDCVDPCDDCGNWIGHQPCAGPIRDSWLSLLGSHRRGKHGHGRKHAACGATGCAAGGCEAAGHCESCAGCGHDGGEPVDGILYDENMPYEYESMPPIPSLPKAAPVQKKATPQQPRTVPYYDREAERSILKPVR